MNDVNVCGPKRKNKQLHLSRHHHNLPPHQNLDNNIGTQPSKANQRINNQTQLLDTLCMNRNLSHRSKDPFQHPCRIYATTTKTAQVDILCD